MRQTFMLWVIVLWGLLSGCGGQHASRGEPFYRRGMNLEAERNYAGAIQAYLTCIGRQPDHAAACYRLAYLNDSQTKDGTELAIHYYRRYLELEPLGKESQATRGRLEAMQQELLEKLAAVYPNTMPKAWNKKLASSYISKEEAERQRQQLNSLRADNADLRRRLDDFASRPAPKTPETVAPATAAKTEPADPKRPEEEPVVPPIQPGLPRFHIVQPNDNLSAVSRKYYGSVRHWRLILDHNKGLLRGSEKNLQPGMRLEIPHLEEKPITVPEPVG